MEGQQTENATSVEIKEEKPKLPAFMKARRKIVKPREFWDPSFEYEWSCKVKPIRPGLNIFNDNDEELEWDYEHDTRFYKNGCKVEDEEGEGPPTKRIRSVVRGRGAVRFGGELELDKPILQHKPLKIVKEEADEDEPVVEDQTEKNWRRDKWNQA